MQRRGWLTIYETAASRRAAQPDLDLRRSRGIRWEELDEGTVRQLVPALRPGPVWGVMFPDCEHTLDPYRLTVALAADFAARGGTILRGDVRTDVAGGAPQRHDGYRPASFDRLAIAAGAFSRKLLRGLGDDAPLDTERGYHVMMDNEIDLRVPLLCADHKFSITPMTEGVRLGRHGGVRGACSAAQSEALGYHDGALACAAAGTQVRDALDLDGLPAFDAGTRCR